MNASQAILEMIKRNLQTKKSAQELGFEYMVGQYDHAIHELAIAYSIAESEDENNPLSVTDVLALVD